MQLDVNLRASSSSTASASTLLSAAGAEHRKALVVNTASIAGKRGQAWLSVYSATKFGVVGFTPGDEQGAGRRGHQVMRAVPRASSTRR